MSSTNKRMKSLVDISSLVAQSTNFFEIKDVIIEKMLEVVSPSKTCINLFHNNDYNHVYLICSKNLKCNEDKFVFGDENTIKFNFYEDYPKYIHNLIEDKKIIYIKDTSKSKHEENLMIDEKYRGKIIFPLLYEAKIAGFVTCYLEEDDNLKEEDIDFINSIVSLIAISIEITQKNNNKNFVIDKLKNSLELISEATRNLYQNKNIEEFLVHLSGIAKKITNSKDAIILIDTNNYKRKLYKYSCKIGEKEIDVQGLINLLLSKNTCGLYVNDKIQSREIDMDADTYIFQKLNNGLETLGVILCMGSSEYEDDDLNMLGILAKQVIVAMQLYDYSEQNVKHKLIANELNILNNQQKLIMNDSKIRCNDKKELEFYHKSATVVGGDFYYAHKIDDKKVAFIIADVMGHGIVANYMVAMIKGAFKTLCHSYNTSGEIATNLNNILYDEFDKMGLFTTALISVFDTKTSELSVANAGHYTPIIIDKDSKVIEDLNCKKGIPIGVLEDMEYASNIFSIKDYPMIFMFTDGILEMKNPNKEEFGLERLKDFVKQNYKSSKDQIVERLKKETENFTQSDNFDDDILILMLKDI